LALSSTEKPINISLSYPLKCNHLSALSNKNGVDENVQDICLMCRENLPKKNRQNVLSDVFAVQKAASGSI
jgi:hypothetical protein